MKLEVFANGLELLMVGPLGLERLKIRGEYSNNEIFTSLFHQFALIHLVAPYLPKVIKTNFPLTKEVRLLINSMYESERKKAPELISPTIVLKAECFGVLPGRIIVAYSGGKDSLWNLWWAQKDYGFSNVLAVHVRGLNRYVSQFEWQYTLRQQRSLGFHLGSIDLLNSSRNQGFKVLRSRDIFLSVIILPLALKFKASKIYIEGGMTDKNNRPFTERLSTWSALNSFLEKIGIPVSIDWRDRDDMDVMKDLLINVPDWLPLVYNCVSSPVWKPSLRRRWKQIAPSFLLYDSQCGSCVKCRKLNLVRVLYDPSLRKADINDIRTFLIDTKDWMSKWKKELGHSLPDSFWNFQNLALRKYGVDLVRLNKW